MRKPSRYTRAGKRIPNGRHRVSTGSQKQHPGSQLGLPPRRLTREGRKCILEKCLSGESSLRLSRGDNYSEARVAEWLSSHLHIMTSCFYTVEVYVAVKLSQEDCSTTLRYISFQEKRIVNSIKCYCFKILHYEGESRVIVYILFTHELWFSLRSWILNYSFEFYSLFFGFGFLPKFSIVFIFESSFFF